MIVLARVFRCRFRFVTVALLGAWIVGGCASEKAPEPTETKEERRLKEKEMMHREMRNE